MPCPIRRQAVIHSRHRAAGVRHLSSRMLGAYKIAANHGDVRHGQGDEEADHSAEMHLDGIYARSWREREVFKDASRMS